MKIIPANRKPYPDPDRPGVYRLPLTRGREALIDAEDAPVVGESLWHFKLDTERSRRGKTGRAERRSEQGRTIQLARVVANATPSERVDFINDDSLDCRQQNLRRADTSELARRHRKQLRSSSPYKGVTKRKDGNCTAYICLGERGARYLGYFKSEIAAAHAYDDAAREHFGAFARLNFPADEKGAA